MRRKQALSLHTAGISLTLIAALAQITYGLDPLKNVTALTTTGEIDRQLISGVSKFLDNHLSQSSKARDAYWRDLVASEPEREIRIQRARQRLAHILGMRDELHHEIKMERTTSVDQATTVATSQHFDVIAVRWNAFADVHGEGLLLRPKVKPTSFVVAIPDADQTPEDLIGITTTKNNDSSLATKLAANGHEVLIPVLVTRQRNQFAWNGRRVDITNREFLYRSAFELGRHIVGYETQKVLAGVQSFHQRDPSKHISVIGWGEGGMIALYAGAIDDRISHTAVAGYFAPRETIWKQPIDRNVFGLLNHFGDAELAAMIGSRKLTVGLHDWPKVSLSGGQGAPAELGVAAAGDVENEFKRALKLAKQLGLGNPPWSTTTTPKEFAGRIASLPTEAGDLRLQSKPDAVKTSHRLQRQMRELDQHNQRVLQTSRFTRRAFMKDLAPSSIESHNANVTKYRKIFAEDVIGRFELSLLPPNARARKTYTEQKWTGYEVVLDVFPDVIAYGLLLVPNDLKPGERRPVVVCQHGLEGRPQDTIGEESHHYYKAFAAELAERGFITFAPQNLYRHRDEFRVLQRKANPLGKTLFSIITPQHKQIVNWLKTQPFVDGDRIGFYGLSYGGKTAMRVPALLPDYCLSICSADFNEWVDKNASTTNPRSYVWTGEYEIFEFDLGSTFNYAEMAALICPRPFMVERGHDDGVADDETVAYEFAKVRRRYNKLGIGDRCEIEWFNGPHTINGKGTFAFLHRHLRWPEPRSK